MPTLREVQASIGVALLDESDARAAAYVVADGVAPTARLAIYRHHVFTTLTAVLEAAYPVVRRLVHERFFAWAAHEYVRAHPPAGPCLFEYGGAFPAFLAGFPPCARLPYLADVARLEWAVHAAAHAEAAVPVDVARLRNVAPGAVAGLVLRLHPSLAVVRSAWPVQRIWEANQPGAPADEIVDLASGGACLEVRRRGDEIVVRQATPGAHALTRALLDGAPLGAATATALDAEPRFDLAAALRRLLHDGLVVAIESTASPCADSTLTPMESKR